MKLIAMRGIPGSGKSTIAATIAEEYPAQIICRDDLRRALGSDKNGNGWSPSLEAEVKAVAKNMLIGHLLQGRDVVVDETHTKVEKLRELASLAEKFGYNFHVVDVAAPPVVCKIRRVPYGFPEDVIDRLFEQFLASEADVHAEFKMNVITLPW